AREMVTLCLALTPFSRLSGLRFCTVCHNLEAEARETAVFQRHVAPLRRGWWWSRLSGRARPSQRLVIDLGRQEAPAVWGARCRPRAFLAALDELLDAEPWPGLDFAETHRQVLLCLEALLDRGTCRRLETAPGEISDETIARRRAFLNVARR
ncbi:MAG: hypothetical protein QHJ73_10115, partial [Armatimonadota bacterium]|nr:hypothetical protein [Armatimonadota bacterium]